MADTFSKDYNSAVDSTLGKVPGVGPLFSNAARAGEALGKGIADLLGLSEGADPTPLGVPDAAGNYHYVNALGATSTVTPGPPRPDAPQAWLLRARAQEDAANAESQREYDAAHALDGIKATATEACQSAINWLVSKRLISAETFNALYPVFWKTEEEKRAA